MQMKNELIASFIEKACYLERISWIFSLEQQNLIDLVVGQKD
jgi:hypothetical protein